jgi:hypothetical protein
MLSESEIKDRARSLYDAALAELEQLVGSLVEYKWPAESQLVRTQKAAVGILIIHSLHLSKAVAALLHADLGAEILMLVRAQFEMGVKLSYIEKHAQKAGDFLLSEPFERYWLAKDYQITVERLASIVADCKAVFRHNPGLVRYQRSDQSRQQRPDFLAIRQGLAFPSMREMILDLGWDLDLYVTVFLFGSLGSHGSINQLRQYVEGIDTSSPRFIIAVDQSGAPDYTLQSLGYLLGMVGAFANWFGTDEELDKRIRPIWEEHQRLVKALHGHDKVSHNQKRIKKKQRGTR